jgi:glutamine synthetase
MFGASTSRNQQLDDHYFGTVPDRIMSYMQELEIELYKMGVPAKTRHNEVAPGQFELAPIFGKANVAADQNQIIMATMQSVALKHDFVCLLHEKPFAGINGSGKHLNWAMSTPSGDNLLEPTDSPHTNFRFLAVIAVICEAVNRHGASLRTAIASHGNDHRLGANEAPPSIISIFLGDTLTKILEAYASGEKYEENSDKFVNVNTDQLARLVKDNTDRNRTSPFAFTGNKFEFRAVGSAANVGIPMTVLNGAVADVFNDVNKTIKAELDTGKELDDVLMSVIKDLYNNSNKVVFNGDGYGQEWVEEAARRGLPNLKTSADALRVIKDTKANEFLTELKIYSKNELDTRYNVRVERYCKHRTIEFVTLINILNKDIVPCIIEAKGRMAVSITNQKSVGLSVSYDEDILKKFNTNFETLISDTKKLDQYMLKHGSSDEIEYAELIASEILPLSEKIAESIAFFENNISDDIWPLPTYYDMLFIK